MGHPKRLKKKYTRPQKPYDKDRIEKEKKLIKEFGLRRKQEIWKAESILRNFRRRARELLANPNELKQKQLFDKLLKIGIKCEKLEDVLSINVEDMLKRRLQTILFHKGFAQTPKQARQLIIHRHVIVDDRKIWWPSYLVKADEENKICISPKFRETKSNLK